MNELKQEINKMLKSKGLSNRIDGIRQRDGIWEWAIENCYGNLEWFHLGQAPKDVEKYVKAMDKIGE